MKSTPDRKLDAITARAIHDPAMRDILTDFGLVQSNPAELRAAMDELSVESRTSLLDRSEELEETSGRTNDAYANMGDFAHRRWIELLKEHDQKAGVMLKGMETAMQAIRAGNRDLYEHHLTKFAEQGLKMTEVVTKARNELRRDIRQMLPKMGINLDTETRAPLVDHLTRAAPVPSTIYEVMTAKHRLEAAKAQQDLANEQRRHLGPRAAPKADLGL